MGVNVNVPDWKQRLALELKRDRKKTAMLGALVLVATPVFRVATSAVLFAVEEDRLYAGLTLSVLLLLVVSLLWIK